MAEIPEQIYVLCNSDSLLWVSPTAGSLAITDAAYSWASRPLGLLHHVLCLWPLLIPTSAPCVQMLWDNTWVVEAQLESPCLAAGLSPHPPVPGQRKTSKGIVSKPDCFLKYYQNNFPSPLFHLLCWLQWMKSSTIPAKK